MRVLIIGATGLLGNALLQEWDKDQIVGVGSREADVRDRSQLHQLFNRYQPEWTVLAAAYTDVDGCEKDARRADEVNRAGALNVACEARDAGSRLLFVSSDYVFDGTKSSPYEIDDATNPINAYGKSKAEAEKGILEIVQHGCILRTSWLFGVAGRCFPNTILESARTHKKLSVVSDQIGRPTSNRDLARTIIDLCRGDAQGIFHGGNTGECSWYEFAGSILLAAGLTNVGIEAICTAAMPRPARRPSYSVLSLKSLQQRGIRMRSWQDALRDYIAERENAVHFLQRVAK